LKYCPECGSQFTTGTEKFCPNCGYDVYQGGKATSEGINKDSINIQNTGGNVTGVGVTGSGNLIGEQITINKTTYNNLEPDFKKSLDEFLAMINKHCQTLEEDKKMLLKESIDLLAGEAQGLKPGELIQDEEKKDEIKSKQITLAEKIVTYLPDVAESIASVTPLAPFSKVIGEGTGYFAEWIREKLAKK
jgi:predicted  nucleic acid-binding Zn-ribbon protein